jgi:DNA-directed RNA polymerase I subunit RPA1
MICRDAFFSRDVYQQMVYAAVGDRYGRIECLPPAIIKPQRLWTGKQIISTIMLSLTKGRVGLNLVGKTQTANAWVAPTTGPLEYPGVPSGSFEDGMLLEGEGTVIFRGGHVRPILITLLLL